MKKIVSVKIYSFIYVALFLLPIFFACKHDKNKDSNSIYPEYGLIGKEILLPLDSMWLYNNIEIHKDLLKTRKKIITYLRANCPSCIIEINDWKALYETKLSNKTENKITPIFIFTGEEMEFFHYFIIEKNIYPFPIYYDTSNFFVRTNHIPQIESLHTIVLNENNVVVFEGSPVLNPKLLETFWTILEN